MRARRPVDVYLYRTSTSRKPHTRGHPTAIAREIAAVACAPAESFGAMMNDDDRDTLVQQLEARLTAALPAAQRQDLFSTEREVEVINQIRASLATDDDRELFGQLAEHDVRKTIIREDLAYLVGIEIGRRASGARSRTRAHTRKRRAASPRHRQRQANVRRSGVPGAAPRRRRSRSDTTSG